MLARILFVATLLVPACLHAQKSYVLGLAGGIASPVGRLANLQQTGPSATIAVAVGAVDLPVGIRVDGIYNRFARKDITFPAGGASTVYSQRVVGGILNLVYAFPGTAAKPYLIAGVGYYNTKALASSVRADNDVGFNGGAGLTFELGPIGSFFEVRYHSISRSVAKGGVIQFVPITFGILL